MHARQLLAHAALASLTIASLGLADQEPLIDPDYFDVPPGISTAVEAARNKPREPEVYEAQLVGLAGSGAKSWVTLVRGSDSPGFNDTEIADAATAVPTSQGVKVIVQNPQSSAPISVVTLTGYTKGTFIFDHHNDVGDAAAASYVRIGGKDSAHVRFHARETRLRVKSSTETRLGTLRTWLEGDFWGGGTDLGENQFSPAAGNQLASNSSSFRLRHGWGEWDITEHVTLGFGQFWANSSAFGFTPTAVDFNPPEGDSFQRGPQFLVRYKRGETTCILSLYNPETDIVNANGVAMAPSLVGAGLPAGATDKMPDITASIQHNFETVWLKAFAVLRLLSIDAGIANSSATKNDSVLGWGSYLSLRWNLRPELALFANSMFGDGIGRWMAGNFVNSGTMNAAGTKISTAFAWSGHGGLTWDISKELQFNAWGAYWTNTDTPAVASVVESGTTLLANMIWHPITFLKMGFELEYLESKRRASNAQGKRSDGNFRATHTTAFFF